MTKLTDTQRRVFDFIQGKLLAGVAAPSVRDISRRFGWSTGKAATEHVNAIIRKGWLVSEPRKARALRLAAPKPPRTSFALRVSGDSMVGRHILHGDIVIFQGKAKPRPDQIVAALIDGKITFKRVVKKNGQTFLISENHPDLIPLGNVVIQGVLRTLLRRTIELDRLLRKRAGPNRLRLRRSTAGRLRHGE